MMDFIEITKSQNLEIRNVLKSRPLSRRLIKTLRSHELCRVIFLNTKTQT